LNQKSYINRDCKALNAATMYRLCNEMRELWRNLERT